jgi:hypothetical protein
MIKKDKVYELKIEEDDDLSGIDSISLVDEPAIEVNWMFFNKVKQEDFHIPDGEDELYLEKLMKYGQSEEEFLAEGWEFVKVIENEKDQFYSTNPNDDSRLDTDYYRVRFKYDLSPNISQSAIIPTTRNFCKTLIQQNRVWRNEDIEAITNDFGDSARMWRGGFNCRHKWFQILYKRTGDIINKSSVNKDKITGPLGVPLPSTPDFVQPNTVTNKTLGNPSPSTIRNLGLSKENFAKISIDYDDTLSTQRGKDLARRLINEGNDLYIVTKRRKTESNDVYRVAREIGIPQDKVFFTQGLPKWRILKELRIQRHIDNNLDEIADIKENAPLIRADKFEIVAPNVNVYGYHTRFFQICPGAQATFEHLISMDNDEDTIGMIRSAAQVADNVFRIEDEVIKSESATQHQYEEAVVLVDDFKDIINEIDKISGMVHDVSYMDGHIEKIREYLKEDMGYDVGTIGGFEDPNIRKKKKKQNMESYSDYPDSVKNNAKAVLKWVDENGWGDCGTDVGKQRANQLANGEPISEETIQRMYSYLSRHKVDLESSKSYDDGCGKLMYDSWGGLSALSWAESKVNSFGKNDMSLQKFAIDSEEKRVVIGPAMVPDLKIYRKDKEGNPYHVYFSADTIKMIAEKYMRNKYLDNNDENHDGTAVKDVYVIESWIKEDMEDKSTKYGYGELPIGTWFVSMKVKNDDVWNKVKQGELNGFSVSGYFEEVAAFCREEMFLKKVAEIIKNIK